LIDRDQALAAVTRRPEWTHLSALGEFRQKILDATADPDARVMRPNGVPGKFKVATKKGLLRELKELEQEIGLVLIGCEEERRIRHYWETDRKGDSY